MSGVSDLAKPLLVAGFTLRDKVLGIVRVNEAAETLFIGKYNIENIAIIGNELIFTNLNKRGRSAKGRSERPLALKPRLLL